MSIRCVWSDFKRFLRFEKDFYSTIFGKLELISGFPRPKAAGGRNVKNIWRIAVNGKGMTSQVQENEPFGQRREKKPPHFRQLNLNNRPFDKEQSPAALGPAFHAHIQALSARVMQHPGLDAAPPTPSVRLSVRLSVSTTFHLPRHHFCSFFCSRLTPHCEHLGSPPPSLLL